MIRTDSVHTQKLQCAAAEADDSVRLDLEFRPGGVALVEKLDVAVVAVDPRGGQGVAVSSKK